MSQHRSGARLASAGAATGEATGKLSPAAYRHMHAEAGGAGFADPDPGLSYEIDNADELARERYHEELAERHYRQVYGDIEAEEQADREYEDQAEDERAELGPD